MLVLLGLNATQSVSSQYHHPQESEKETSHTIAIVDYGVLNNDVIRAVGIPSKVNTQFRKTEMGKR